MKHRIIGFINGNKIIDTGNAEELKGLDFDEVIVYEHWESKGGWMIQLYELTPFRKRNKISNELGDWNNES